MRPFINEGKLKESCGTFCKFTSWNGWHAKKKLIYFNIYREKRVVSRFWSYNLIEVQWLQPSENSKSLNISWFLSDIYLTFFGTISSRFIYYLPIYFKIWCINKIKRSAANQNSFSYLDKIFTLRIKVDLQK